MRNGIRKTAAVWALCLAATMVPLAHAAGVHGAQVATQSQPIMLAAAEQESLWQRTKHNAAKAWHETKHGAKKIWQGTKDVTSDAYHGAKKTVSKGVDTVEKKTK